MTPEKALELLKRIEKDSLGAQNVVAQGSARAVLFSVKEPWANIRKIDFRQNLDAALDNLAFLYLAIGCCLMENKQEQSQAIEALRKGARLLEFNHLHEANQRFHSHYCLLVAALGYYAASQYSKAFILLKRTEEYDMPIGQLASLFLKKELTPLTDALTEILADDDYIGNAQENIDERIHVLLFARACAHALEYLQAGNGEDLAASLEILDDLQTLLLADREPSGWWVARLFKIIVEGFRESSLWAAIPPLFSPDSELVPKKLQQFMAGLIFREKPVTELFVSQRQALPKALDERGAVLSLPTGSGKTRIAEIAILKCLVNDPFAKALYLVPTRSLALEVENELDDSLGQLGFEVSLLYGGSGLTGLDISAIDKARILIATTEKAKAILRANESLASQIRLLIFDEGHLLGANERYVRSELFIEEMRLHLKRNGGKILSLSAVLPNVGDIAQWITGDETQAEKCEWRPSRQRLGWLIYQQRNTVRIEWMPENGVNSFNERFIEGASNKHEAIVATAAKLSITDARYAKNCVLVFVGSTPSVKKYARTAADFLNRTSQTHEWDNEGDWYIFELACKEFYGKDSDLLDWAKVGVICHHGKLPTDVRFAMERLMRRGNPRIIVATTTLAEGVNLGISSVIFTTKFIASPNGNKPISNSKFWNIAGRAGRAFTDTEGKILYFIDQKSKTTADALKDKTSSQNDYFKPALEPAESGLLICLRSLKIIASQSGVNFELLLQLVGENDLSRLGQKATEAAEIFDMIDDTLLALDIAHTEEWETEPAIDWLDDRFRASLAYLQAQKQTGFPAEDVIRFLKARLGHIRQASGDLANRKRLAASSLPWRSALAMQGLHIEALTLVEAFQSSPETLEGRLVLLENLEALFNRLPSKEFQNNPLPDDKLKTTRKAWLSGDAVGEDFPKTFSEHFTYKIPWALNALSQQLAFEHPEAAKILENLALCCETGLPDEIATGIYLAGIRSRAASVELSWKVDPEIFEFNSSKMVKEWMIEQKDWLYEVVSGATKQWIQLLVERQKERLLQGGDALPLRSFAPNEILAKSSELFLRRINGNWLLCSPDFTEKTRLPASLEIPSGFSGHIRIGFARTDEGWKMLDRKKDQRIH